MHVIEIIPTERKKLYDLHSNKLETAYNLNRKAVSFQANKSEPVYNWFKYKEGFSSTLVKYFIEKYSSKPGIILDPFAGVGTTLFAGQELGWQTYGVELLPVGVFVMNTREATKGVDVEELKKIGKSIWKDLSKIDKHDIHINHIPITRDAFPEDTEIYLNKYLTYCSRIKDKKIQTILRFAAFAILEGISYTRKDGQYLRWDYRSKRALPGKPFNKGKIVAFEAALKNKLNQIIFDLLPDSLCLLFDRFDDNKHGKYPINIIQGSCLEELPKLEDEFFDFIVTSPPYCNRYDYTRTYALELVFWGCDSERVRDLRQTMLSCTVENKEKIEYLNKFYSSIGRTDTFDSVLKAYHNSKAMTEINTVLNELNKQGKINNNNIPRMVKNYFLEMCFVIYEMSRVIRQGGYCVMVNDNVRYGGEEIPVDLILSGFAEKFGFKVNKIFVLPKGKGNSSQQMGNYGRTEIRKCVYLWQKN